MVAATQAARVVIERQVRTVLGHVRGDAEDRNKKQTDEKDRKIEKLTKLNESLREEILILTEVSARAGHRCRA